MRMRGRLEEPRNRGLNTPETSPTMTGGCALIFLFILFYICSHSVVPYTNEYLEALLVEGEHEPVPSEFITGALCWR